MMLPCKPTLYHDTLIEVTVISTRFSGLSNHNVCLHEQQAAAKHTFDACDHCMYAAGQQGNSTALGYECQLREKAWLEVGMTTVKGGQCNCWCNLVACGSFQPEAWSVCPTLSYHIWPSLLLALSNPAAHPLSTSLLSVITNP
jgi:hypothetical protein